MLNGRVVVTSSAAEDLTVRDLTVTYDGPQVLSEVSLEVAAGEVLALLGPSGCGKTTLLRTIAGLERQMAGSVRLGERVLGDDTSFVPPEKRRIGMVFQDGALFPHLDVEQNVAYGLPRAERRTSRVAETLELVGLDGLEGRRPGSLSGGQQQRVALARALAPRPGVLLLDEPFSSLDTSLRVHVRAEIHHLLLELGVTTVFVTHDQEEAFVLGDRVAVLNDGKVAQVGRPDDLYRRPANRWVATFVGDANLLPVDDALGICDTAVGPVPVDRSKGPGGGPAKLLVRPEDLRLADGSTGTVELIEYYGHDAMVRVLLGDGSTVHARTGADVRWQRGDLVGVTYVGPGAVPLEV
tara:strand:+ start:166 stop:1224 length:1059 start_codon:yes stop_codon:yes gene_type:complete